MFKFLIVGFLVFICRVVGSYRPVEATAASTLPIVRGGYDITDFTKPIVGPEFMDSIHAVCRMKFNRRECSRLLDDADNRLKLLFDTSDRDQHDIYRKLFENSADSQSLASRFAAIASRLRLMNSTVFGTNASGEMQPGLIRDIVSISDGINQLRSISLGEKQSVTAARLQQHKTMKAVAQNAKADSAVIASKLEDLMKTLVEARTLVQTGYFRSMWQYANSTLSDIGSQSEDFLRESQDKLFELTRRYKDWTSLTFDEIASTKERTSSVLLAINDIVGKMIPNMESVWKENTLRTVSSVVSDSVKHMSSDLSELKETISGKIGKLNSAAEKRLDLSRSDFAANQTVLQTNIDDKLQYLADQVGPNIDGRSVDKTDQETRETLQSKIQTITDMIKSVVVPLMSDVKTGLQQSGELASDINSTKTLIAKDGESVIESSRTDLVGLKEQLDSVMDEAKKTFDYSIESRNSELDSRIDDKVKTAKGQLGRIFGSIQQVSSNVATDQNLQEIAAKDTLRVSDTAAELAAAKQKQVSDSASVKLQSGVGIFSSSLADTSATADSIFKKNEQKLIAAQADGNTAKQKLIEKAQSQLGADSLTSQSIVSSVSNFFHKSQLASEDLDATIQQSGQFLDQALRAQLRDASPSVDEASLLATRAEQGGNALLNEIGSLESLSSEALATFFSRLKSTHSAIPKPSNLVGESAVGILSNLTSALGQVTGSPPRPVPTSFFVDQGTLSADVSRGPSAIKSETRMGSNLITARSNRAMVQSVKALQSTSSDSQTALANLLNYNADLVDTKRKLALSSGGSAVNASLDAAKYLAVSGNNYMGISERFLDDLDSLGAKGVMNQSIALASINETLTDITGIVERFMEKLDKAVGKSTVLLDVKNDALGIIAGMGAKVNETIASISSVTNGTIDTASILATAKNLNEYIESLKSSFELQRASFNRYAQQVAVRRIAALTGLSESVIAQKVSTLDALAQSDKSETDSASKTTEMLQTLQRAVEAAHSQGDVSKVTSLISSIGDRVTSFSQRLTNQMQGIGSSLSQKTNASTSTVGRTLGSLAFSAATSAGSFGQNLLNALDTVQHSDLAATIAAQGGQKDVFAIAGMVKKLDIVSQQKIFELLSRLKSGNMTLTQATFAAQQLQSADINSISDVLLSITPYIARHESMVNTFRDHLNLSASTIESQVFRAIKDHEGLQGDVVADMGATEQLLAGLRVSVPSQLNESGSELVNRINEVENVSESIFNANQTDPVSEQADSSGWFNLVLAPSSFSEVSNSTVGIQSRVMDLERSSRGNQQMIDNATRVFVSEIDKDIAAGERVFRTIIDAVKSSTLEDQV